MVAGAIAGGPGAVDATPDAAAAGSDDAASAPRAAAAAEAVEPGAGRRGRGRWLTAAALLLIANGIVGILYGPVLTGSTPVFLGLGFTVLTIVGVAAIVVGVGLLRVDAWARGVAALVAALGLAFVQAPGLMALMADGDASSVDWPGLVANLVVLFAVLRRWPPPARVG